MAESSQQRWNRTYHEKGWGNEPAGFLVECAEFLPVCGRAIDVGGGPGRNAIWLAQRGLEVTLVDISDEALDMAAKRVAEAGVALSMVRLDLEEEPFPAGPWDVVFLHHYLHRPLFPVIEGELVDGGVLLVCQPTQRNFERHEHPSRRFLLAEGELPGLVPGLRVLRNDEGLYEDRYEVRFVGVKDG